MYTFKNLFHINSDNSKTVIKIFNKAWNFLNYWETNKFYLTFFSMNCDVMSPDFVEIGYCKAK